MTTDSYGPLWNYRVIEFVEPSNDEPYRSIHEVYYDEDGKPNGYIESAASVFSEDAKNEDLLWVLEKMRMALDKPVLVEADFHQDAP